MSKGKIRQIGSRDTSSGNRCIVLGKSPRLASSLRQRLIPGPSPDGMKGADEGGGPYAPLSINLQAKTNIHYTK